MSVRILVEMIARGVGTIPVFYDVSLYSRLMRISFHIGTVNNDDEGPLAEDLHVVLKVR